MNILFDIQHSSRGIEERNSSPLPAHIKRTHNSPQVSTKTSKTPGNPGTHKEKTSTIEVKRYSSEKGDLTPQPRSPATGSQSNDKKIIGKISKNGTSNETVQRKKQLGSSSPCLSRPESTSSTAVSEKSYLHLHREKKAHQQPSESDHTSPSVAHSNTTSDTQTTHQQTGKRRLTSKFKLEHMETILNRLMLRPSEDKRKFSNIVDVLSHDMRKKGMKNVLIQYLHENQPKYSVSHFFLL